MRASIIIAAHQEGALLAKTIESCLRADADLEREIIVADDASSDGSVDDVAARFPELQIVRHSERLGVAPTKDLGARRATGDVLVFLDAHTNPEPGAISRLVEDVERLEGAAAVTPAIASLCHRTWRNQASQTGHGYSLELETFKSAWLPIDKLRKVERAGTSFYESPALIGCAFAVARELHDRLWGFDTAMRLWGVEDLDFSLKCWLMGHPILHDPEAVIGHRFQESFSSYRVSAVQILVSQMRMAYKNLSRSVWREWLRICRERYAESQSDLAEGFYAAAWHEFKVGQASAERERVYLSARRMHDDLWYSDYFGLEWPALNRPSPAKSLPVILHPFADPSPTPKPCQIGSVQFLCDGAPTDPPDPIYAFLGTTITFQVVAANPQQPCPDSSVSWSGSSGASGTGNSTSVRFGNTSASPTDYKTVTATCGNSVTVNVVVYDLLGKLTPADNFAGRDQTQYGLNEDVQLTFDTQPAGLTASQIGRLQWSVVQGAVGTIANATESGTGTYNAGPTPGATKLDLTLLDCPSDGLHARYLKTVIAPNGGTCVRVSGSGIWHCEDTYSIGLNTNFYLSPRTVSCTAVRAGITCLANSMAVLSGWGANTDPVHHR